jgi:chromosomal replication initiation ATPase DnaA
MTQQQLLTTIATFYAISETDITEITTDKNIIEARQIYCYFLYKHFKLKSYAIGRMVSQNHTTVLKSIKRVGDLFSVGDTQIVKSVNYVTKLLK